MIYDVTEKFKNVDKYYKTSEGRKIVLGKI